MPNVTFTMEEAASLADAKPALLKLWLQTEKFKPSTTMKSSGLFGGWEMTYYFNEQDIQSLITFAASQHERKPSKNNRFVDDGVQETFTVAEVASLWKLSTDTVQRLFEDEPGVITLGDKNPRGKRKRVTLRIPRSVTERVKKVRSNPK